MRRGGCAVVPAESRTTRSCKLAAVFCPAVRFAAVLLVHTQHTHICTRRVKNCHQDSYRPSNWHLGQRERLKGQALIGRGRLLNLAPDSQHFPVLLLSLTHFLWYLCICIEGFGPLV